MDEKKADGVENEAVEQLAFADRILLNKRDLISEQELEVLKQRIRALNHFAPMEVTLQSKVNLDFILNIGAFDLARTLQSDPAFLMDQQHQVIKKKKKKSFGL